MILMNDFRAEPVALRAAMLAFWRHGYEGTSLAELTAAVLMVGTWLVGLAVT